MRESIILIGGGGHCKSCIDVIESEGRFEIAGIIDVKDRLGDTVLDYSIIGTDADIPEIVSRHKNALITVGQIETVETRKHLYNLAKQYGAELPVIVAPSARISPHSTIMEGSIIMHGAVINAGAVVGRNCIINTAAVIEHDVNIGDHCHISTACIINGGCRLGSEVFIGSNSVVSNSLALSDSVIIGAGSVMIRSIGQKGVYAGSPARKIK